MVQLRETELISEMSARGVSLSLFSGVVVVLDDSGADWGLELVRGLVRGLGELAYAGCGGADSAGVSRRPLRGMGSTAVFLKSMR